MYLPVSALPGPPKNMPESADSDFGKNPVNEEHDCQVSNDEIVSQKDAQVQIMRHNSSFLRGDNSWKDIHELNHEVIYIEGADLNETRVEFFFERPIQVISYTQSDVMRPSAPIHSGHSLGEHERGPYERITNRRKRVAPVPL